MKFFQNKVEMFITIIYYRLNELIDRYGFRYTLLVKEIHLYKIKILLFL